jgi:hypothetical protein
MHPVGVFNAPEVIQRVFKPPLETVLRLVCQHVGSDRQLAPQIV